MESLNQHSRTINHLRQIIGDIESGRYDHVQSSWDIATVIVESAIDGTEKIYPSGYRTFKLYLREVKRYKVTAVSNE